MTIRSRPRGRRPWPGGSLTLALLLGLAPSRGEAVPEAPVTSERSTNRERVVVVVVGPSESELTARLVDELCFLGLAPEVLPSSSSSDQVALSTMARDAGVEAVIRVDPSAGLLEIWITRHATDEPIFHSMTTSLGVEEPRALAVRTAELFRALRADVRHERPPPAPGSTPGPAARPSLGKPPPRFGIFVGAGVGRAPGDVPVAAYGRAQLRYMAHPNMGIMLTGMSLLRAVDIGVAGNEARLRTAAIAVGPRFALRRPDAIVVPDLSVAIGAMLVDMRPTTGNGNHVLAADAKVEGSAGIEVRLSRRVRLRGEVAVGACTRTIRVRFSGQPVAAWCSPHALGVLGLGLAL